MKIIKRISTLVVGFTFGLLGLGVLLVGCLGTYKFAEVLYPVVGWWNIPIIIGLYLFLVLFVLGIIELEKGE
jgi:hypothetical protein